MDQKVKLYLGKPNYGWLPVTIKFNDFELSFEASDVPFNPIELLISSVREITKGLNTEIWWHLEPGGYYFSFIKELDVYRLNISFEESGTSGKKSIYSVTGNYDNIVMPFYRAVKSFLSMHTEEIDWPPTSKERISKLVEVVANTKAR